MAPVAVAALHVVFVMDCCKSVVSCNLNLNVVFTATDCHCHCYLVACYACGYGYSYCCLLVVVIVVTVLAAQSFLSICRLLLFNLVMVCRCRL